MKQEEKELLFLDLCSRLPYGVKVESVFINPDTKEHKSCGIEVFDATSILMIRDGLGEFKPYLFPLSSMTEEQIEEAKTYFWKDVDYGKSLVDKGINCFYPCFNILEFYHKYHLDYRGLIPKGLAIDCTNLNIY